jgi:hypothetical protein
MGRDFLGRFLPAGELFSLSVFRPVEVAVSISHAPPPHLGFRVRRYTRGGDSSSGPGWPPLVGTGPPVPARKGL